jgi:DNA repair exonuclease SbcCD nuclease subunit
MITFLHAADIHLDSPLQGLERYEGAPVDEIRGATRRALENLVETALEREVDFVLIAGDLYDGDWKDHNTGLFFVRQMSRLREAGIPAVLISGNHDAANRMTKSLRLPENVELLSHRQAQTASSGKLRDLGVAVHGRSFGRPAEYENLASSYPQRLSGMFNIGLLHTSLTGAEGHEPYAPCSHDDLRRKRYDYWALGHVHAREVACDDPPIVFCGNLQGRHIRETGPKGCYLVRAEHGVEPHVEFLPLDVFRWDVCQVPAGAARRGDDLLEIFAQQLSRLLTQHPHLPLTVRVELTGRSAAHQELLADVAGWTQQIRAAAVDASAGRVWVEKVKLRTAPMRDLEEVARQEGPIGELVRYVGQLRQDDEGLRALAEELTEFRRKLPEELLRGEDALPIDDPRHLRRVLEEVRSLLLNRLVD